MATEAMSWKWGEEKKAMLKRLAISAEKANAGAYEYLKAYALNLLHEKALNQSASLDSIAATSLDLLFLGITKGAEPDDKSWRGNLREVAVNSLTDITVEKDADKTNEKALEYVIQHLGTSGLHDLIGKMMSNKPLPKVLAIPEDQLHEREIHDKG